MSTQPTLTEAGFEVAAEGIIQVIPKEGRTVRALLPATLLAALILAPLSHASASPSARVDADDAWARSLAPPTTVTSAPDSLTVTVRREWASSGFAYEWRFALSESESLAELPDGSIAVAAPWPPDAGDGTYYPPEDDSVPRGPPPLPANDPYRYSADPDGSMAADEALHDVGPFDPRYPDEYLPDPWADEPRAVDGPPPEADTSDPIEPSDDEPVGEVDALDQLIAAEGSRSDQIVALVTSPRGQDALGRRVPVRLAITKANTVELRFRPVLTGAFPFTASSRVVFNPDALP